MQKEFIEDENDAPPEVHNGKARLIPDPNSSKPDYWDDDDDGPWEADLVPNPDYDWKPRMIRNPNYVPPPGYASKLGDEVLEALPWVTLGVLLVAALAIVPLPLDALRSHLGGNGPFAACKAAFIGLATPLCSCGSLPIAAGFVEAGLPLSSVVAFLTASQSAGLDSAAITFGLLGPMAAICRLVGALILAIAAGTVLKSSNDTSSVKKEAGASNGQKASSSTSLTSVVSKFIAELIDTASEIIPLVVIGLGISTAAVHFVPMLTAPFDVMKDHEIVGKLLIRLGVLASALPLQLCEHTTAALAAGIQKAGGSSGLAFAFLLSAPAINIPSLLLLARTSGTASRLAAIKVAAALSGTALVLSYVVDFIGVDLLVVKEAESDVGGMAALPSWFVTASPWIAGSLLAGGIVRKLMLKSSKKTDDCACPSVSCDSKSSKKND